jgi:tRNA threonylcarbamoyladenosine biosynthesis protein TsaB
VAIGTTDGTLLDATDWPAGYRHGESLMPAIEGSLERLGIERGRIAAVVVGTGPGAFTGLRVGIATAKGLAHGLARPIIGVSTAEALLSGAPEGAVLLLPAGPSDRLRVPHGGPATLVPAGSDPAIDPGTALLALDLEGRAPSGALELGEAARARLGASLLAIGAARLAAGEVDDLARLVPEYVTLPRGVQAVDGEVSWSHDRR